MKKTIKLFRLLFTLLFLSFAIACSSDDDEVADPSNEEVNVPEIPLIETEIILPEAIKNNPDPKAQELVQEIALVKLYENYIGFTMIPPGAEVGHEPIITAENSGKNTSHSAIDYTVYSFSYQGTGVIYQFSEQNGMEVIEVFISMMGSEYFKYMEIRQTLDGKSGSMQVFGFEEEEFTAEWEWQINSDGTIDVYAGMYSGGNAGLVYDLHYNPDDNSGNLKVYLEGQLQAELTCYGNGSGTWINHITGETGSW